MHSFCALKLVFSPTGFFQSCMLRYSQFILKMCVMWMHTYVHVYTYIWCVCMHTHTCTHDYDFFSLGKFLRLKGSKAEQK